MFKRPRLTLLSLCTFVTCDSRSRDNSFGITTYHGLDGRDLIPASGKISLFSIGPRPALWPTQPPIQRLPGPFSRGIKRQGRGQEWWRYTVRVSFSTCFGLMWPSSGTLGLTITCIFFLLLSLHWPVFTHWECVICMVLRDTLCCETY
jgi:hypothetical protein